MQTCDEWEWTQQHPGQKAQAQRNSPRNKRSAQAAPQRKPCTLMSDHARLRAAQRGLSDADLECVTRFGTLYRGMDADYLYLRRADLPTAERKASERLVGTALVISKEGCVITVWRNAQNGLRNIREKLRAPAWASPPRG